MEIQIKEVVSVQHYSALHAFSSVIEKIDGQILHIRIVKDFLKASMLEEDPIVLGVKQGEEMIVFGCNIVKIDLENKVILVRRDNVVVCENKRLNQRFPISLYADILSDDRKKKTLTIVKDISEGGFRIYTKNKLDIGEKIELNIYAGNSMLFVKGRIVRELKRQHNYEYGIEIKYDSMSALQSIKQYIKKIELIHDQFLTRINNINL